MLFPVGDAIIASPPAWSRALFVGSVAAVGRGEPHAAIWVPAAVFHAVWTLTVIVVVMDHGRWRCVVVYRRWRRLLALRDSPTDDGSQCKAANGRSQPVIAVAIVVVVSVGKGWCCSKPTDHNRCNGQPSKHLALR